MSTRIEQRDRGLRQMPGHGESDTDRLFRRLAATGDLRVREELVTRFMPLARKLAGRYATPNEPFEDLVQVANIGLMGAIDRYDPERGVAFTSFAIPTILGELKRYFRGTGWSAHVSRRAQELALSIDRAVRELSAHSGRTPSVVELAQYLELEVDDVLTGLDAGQARYSVSLESPATGSIGDGEPEPMINTIGDDDEGFGLTEVRLSLAQALQQLPRPEREALGLRLSGDLKQREIAERMGCSQMQVSRLLRRAATQVRELLEPRSLTQGR